MLVLFGKRQAREGEYIPRARPSRRSQQASDASIPEWLRITDSTPEGDVDH